MSTPPRKRTITKMELIDDITGIGLSRGDTVAVTINYGSIGSVVGGPQTVLDSLLEVLGSEGTLMMNTFSQISPPFELSRDYVFNPESTTSTTGYVTELLRLRPDAVRSHHPAFSIAAIGRNAEYLIRDHDEKVQWLLPYYKLARLGGKYLSIGLKDNLVAIRHSAQILTGLYSLVPTYYTIRYNDKHGETKIYTDHSPCSKNLDSLTPLLIEKNAVRRGEIGMAPSLIGDANEIIIESSRILAENPTLNLCNTASCIWCREVEKKLGLYDNIAEPKYFQRPFIRQLVRLVNEVRLSKYNYIIYSDSWKGPSFLRSLYLFIYSKLRARLVC